MRVVLGREILFPNGFLWLNFSHSLPEIINSIRFFLTSLEFNWNRKKNQSFPLFCYKCGRHLWPCLCWCSSCSARANRLVKKNSFYILKEPTRAPPKKFASKNSIWIAENETTQLVGVVEDEGQQPDIMDQHQEFESSQTMRIKANAVERPSITTSSTIITATAKNVTVAHGKTALLTCKIGVGLLMDNRTVFIHSLYTTFV